MRILNSLSHSRTVIPITHTHIHNVHAVLYGPLEPDNEVINIAAGVSIENFHRIEVGRRFHRELRCTQNRYNGTGDVCAMPIIIKGHPRSHGGRIKPAFDLPPQPGMGRIDSCVQNGDLYPFFRHLPPSSLDHPWHGPEIEFVCQQVRIIELTVELDDAPRPVVPRWSRNLFHHLVLGGWVLCTTVSRPRAALVPKPLDVDLLIVFDAQHPRISGQILRHNLGGNLQNKAIYERKFSNH
jgi:hypothetical protein